MFSEGLEPLLQGASAVHLAREQHNPCVGVDAKSCVLKPALLFHFILVDKLQCC